MSKHILVVSTCSFTDLQQDVEVAAVIADRAARTPKYLYGVTRGCHILKPAHLQARSTHCREAAEVGRLLCLLCPCKHRCRQRRRTLWRSPLQVRRYAVEYG